MGNRQRAALPALALAGMLAIAPLTARATTTGECIDLVSGLKGDTQSQSATTFKNERDRVGLLGKLDSATSKLSATKGSLPTKVANAYTTMLDYDSKVVTLYGDGKVPQATYSLLHDGYDLSTNTATGWGSQQVLACIAAIAP